jgi:uncharacterized protein
MKTIAVVGASGDRRKFGNKCVRAYVHAGYKVFPVNPNEAQVEGLATYARLQDVPEELDRISIYLPPPTPFQVLPDIAEKGAREVWFNPGAADSRVIEEARRREIPVRNGCSIVDLGLSPAMFP